MCRPSESLKVLFQAYSPEMAKKAKEVSEDWVKKTANRTPQAHAPFEFFFSAWINLPAEVAGMFLSLPHKDWKNYAAFWCALFCYGEPSTLFLHVQSFNNSGLGVVPLNQSVFLVLWELGIILEFLPGSWIFLTSALLTHFNVDAASKPLSPIWGTNLTLPISTLTKR